MKLTTIASIVAAMLLVTGCSSSSSTQSSASGTDASTLSADQEELEIENADAEGEGAEGIPLASVLEGLTQDEYGGLEITVEVQDDEANPGAVIPVTVTVRNTGEETLLYTHGSGSYETPQALVVQSDGLQVVTPEDRLGAATMDYVTAELEPEGQLEFTVYVMAVEPHEEFDDYTHDLYNQEERYIATVEWEELTGLYPDLRAVEPGEYTGSVSFLYSVRAEAGEAADDTGEAETDEDTDTGAEAEADSETGAAIDTETAGEDGDDDTDTAGDAVIGDATGYGTVTFTITIAE